MLEFYRTGGGSSPIVAVHGWAADGRIWNTVAGTMGDRLDLWIPDLPGHGRTPLHMSGRQLSDYHSMAVDGLCSWAEESDLLEAPLISWAWGTWVALDAVASGRLRPRSMLLVSFAPSADVPVPYDGPIVRDWPRYVRMIVRLMVASVVSPETEDWLVKIMERTSPAAAAGVHLAGWQPPGPDFRLPAGTILISGERDRIQPGDEGLEIAADWGASGLYRVPGAGHVPFIEEQALFNELLTEWLRRIGAHT